MLVRCFCLTGEAVFARCLSALKEERVVASKSLAGPQGAKFTGDKTQFLEDIRKVSKEQGSLVYLIYSIIS